ncbi:chemotaxis protein CheC [Thermosyntropha sp.]|uniref:chemotaxis protein CheC n=1 Tax=Thermosyntropha sp. TaxID=2740820 RepID=UPI0025F54BE6|nr:chemotaxis protein CheC [Thermosyntropha sp.]MBO8159373.1 chemotaxis protein CheC [Thermosyntropha sp.]
MAEDFDKLSSLQLDALREIGNIGAGNAATALAQMINSKIDMSVPQAKILLFSQVPELVGGSEQHVVGIYLRIEGSAPSSILFVIPIKQACLLVDMLMSKPLGTTSMESFGDMEMSAMMELGNIISATYLNALAAFTGLKLLPSVPALGIDMAGAVMDAVLAQFGEVADHVLVLETDFKKESVDIVGHFILLPEPGSLKIILQSLGVSI